MTWLAGLGAIGARATGIVHVRIRPMGPRVSGVEVRRLQAADGLSHMRGRRRRLMLGNAGGRIDTREFHRSADGVKKAASLA
jgi:hypothetical protein